MDSDRVETVLSGILLVAFLAGGSIKFLGGEAVTTQFQAWGYPAWFAYVVGVTELAGALSMLAGDRRVGGAPVRFWGAALLAATMGGAAATHLRFGEWRMLTLATGLLLVAAALALRVRPRELELRW